MKGHEQYALLLLVLVQFGHDHEVLTLNMLTLVVELLNHDLEVLDALFESDDVSIARLVALPTTVVSFKARNLRRHDLKVLAVSRDDRARVQVEEESIIVGIVLQLLVGQLVHDLRLHVRFPAHPMKFDLARRVISQLRDATRAVVQIETRAGS